MIKNAAVILAVLFWLLLAADCLLIAENLSGYRVYTKTLLVPVLMAGIIIVSKDTRHKRSCILSLVAFLCCFAGDLLLLAPGDIFFIMGLSAFLLGHSCFIVFFLRLKKFSLKYALPLLVSAVFVYVYTGCLLLMIWPQVAQQHLEIPVILYALVIGMMLVAAIHTTQNKSVRRIAGTYFIPGAVLFVLSDSLLALNRFGRSFAYADIVVMITYAAAIFTLYAGITAFLKK